MPAGAWFRNLFSLGRLDRTSKQRFHADSLVPQLSIKRLEERLVLNADVAPVEVLVVNAGDAAADGQADVYQVEQVENEIRVSVNGQEVRSIAADRVSSIQIAGSSDNDVLVADLLAGVDLVFDGGGGQDSISVAGGEYDLVGYESNGSSTDIAAHSSAGVAKVELTGVEQINDSLNAAERSFAFDGPGRQITLGESTQDNFNSRIVASGEGGVTVDFLNPSDSLSIDTSANGAAADTVAVVGVGNGFNADLRVIGGANDAFELNGEIDLGRGNLTVSTGSVVLDRSITSADADFQLQGAQSVTINHDAALFNAGGSVTIAAPEISLRGMVAAAGGFVSLDSGADGVTKVEGVIDVSNLAEGGQGGEVQLLGKNVQLLGTARIVASGHSGGGTVLVGGGRQGSDSSVRNGQYTYVGTDVVVNVDAVFAGFGGTAIFWADKVTAFYGIVTARGGIAGGNGGFVEISGKDSLAFNGWADASATAGKAGTVLFDPTDIVINNGAVGANNALLPDLSGVGAIPLSLSELALEALAAVSNIIITATNNITLNDLADNVLSLLTATGSLTITADSDNSGAGTFSMNAGDTIQTVGGNITISGNALNLGGLSSAGGDISITGDALTLRELNSAGGNITLVGNGAVSLNDAVNAAAGTVRLVSQGNVTQAAAGLITAGSLGIRQESNTGNIVLTQANDVGQFAASNADLNGSVQFTDVNGFAVSTVASLGDFDATQGITTNVGNVTLVSGALLDINQAVTTGGGSLTVTTVTFDSTGQTISTVGGQDLDGGAVQITATGQLTVGPITTSGGTDGGGGAAEPAGLVSLTGGDIAVVGAITATGSNDVGNNGAGGAGGAVTLNAATITLSAGINSAGGTGTSTGAGGNVTFNGAGTVTTPVEISAGTATIDVNSTLAAGANALTLSANEIEFDGGANSISGTGALTLQPSADNTAIDIGSPLGGAGVLDLSDSDLAALDDGFAGITFGRATGQHAIVVGSASFKDAVTVRTPAGGSIRILDELNTLAGGGSITLFGTSAAITLSDNLVTAGFVIDIQGNTVLGQNISALLDSTNAGTVAAGAAINVTGTINGTAAGGTETLRINAGTTGAVSLDEVGNSVLINLTIIDSGSTTISGMVDINELDIQDTSSSVTLEDVAEINMLTTAAQPYSISLLGTDVEITSDTNFLNTGAVTLGNNAGDVILFDGGINTTTGPTQLNLFGQLRTSGDQIDLGTVVLQGNSEIDATNNGGIANGANINVGAITGNSFSLTIEAGNNGDVALTTVAAAGASLAALTVNADDVTLAGNVFADSQDYNADVNTSALLDTTDGGGNPAGGLIDISGALTGVSPQLNAGTGGAITIGSATLISLTIINSGSTIISGAASMSTLDIQDTTNMVTIQGNATLTTLTTAAQGYGVSLLGTTNTITNDTNFLNTGAVTLGNNANDVILFDGGIDTTTGPSQTNLFGRLRTSGDQIDLGGVNLQGDSRIDATNNGGVATGASINLGSITGSGNDLELNAGTTGAITVPGSSLNLGALTITQTVAANFQGSLTAVSLVTTAQPYTLTLVGSNNSVTNDVNFLNTGTLTLGNSATDVFLFDGGVDITGGPTAFNLFGQLRTSGDQIDLAAVTLLGNSEIDATNDGGTAAGGNINVGTITGDNLTLTMDAGTSGDMNLAAVGATGTSLASFVLVADTATLSANIVADVQNYTADLILAEALDLLLDSTDGGALLFSGPINVTGSVNGTAGGATELFRVDAGALGGITLDDLGNTTALNATILNSLSTTIAGSVTLGFLSIVDTTLGVSILGNADVDTLATAVQPYSISLLGSNNEITNGTAFLNTNEVTLGDSSADVFLFSGGINTTTGPSQTNLFGQLRTSGDQIVLGTLVLTGDSQLDSTNNGGAATGANINTGAITGIGNDLEFDAGTAGNIAFGQVGALASAIGDLTITMAQAATAFGTIDAASLVQSAGTGITDLQGNITVTDTIDITTDTIRIHGPGGGVNLIVTAFSVELDAMTRPKLDLLDVLIDTTSNPMGGRMTDKALLPTVLDMSMSTGLPLAPPAVIVAELMVIVNDPLGQNFTVEVDWRFSERPGIPAPAAVIIPPSNIAADVLAAVVDGVSAMLFEHQYDDSPETNPGDDINVSIAITQFANDTILLQAGDASILDNAGITVNVIVPVDSPLFGFVLVPAPGALPVTPPQAPPATPFAPPAVQVIQISNNPFEPNSAGATGRAEVRYYELRIVSFDENGNLVESFEERINLSDPRLEAITPFNPSKLPELFKRLPGDRYRIYLIEDGAERLMIEFVIEQVGDEGRPVELPERIESDGRGAPIQEESLPEAELQDRSTMMPGMPTVQPTGRSFIEELGRASFVSSGGLVFGAAMLSKSARQKRESQADQRMAAFRKRLRERAKQSCQPELIQ